MRFILYLVIVSCLVPALQAVPGLGHCREGFPKCCTRVGAKLVCGDPPTKR
ncbi:hypothetical protein PGT21_016818 [Puccinia graminis f. sp. tritici]|uniref:Hydrophobin n=1 Tax=Puccinia graminis f. sp. tritici TaxID=56615 RepID=A0A5B0PEW5_PUCGR|nr:hypothetical protein PGTUg99_023279 [Puccinia graminis f. sp. tritici]KAA1099673.1 hypothetical protein PGT21_016818 [Puccinia graminis f. sp. tritici]